MGLAQSVPRYNVSRANSRTYFILDNSDTSKGVWKIRFFKNYTTTVPRFILTLGDTNNTKATFTILNPNGTVESTTDLGAFVIGTSQNYYLDICNDVLTLTTAVVASSNVASSNVASASASASAPVASSIIPLITVTNADFPNIVSVDANNDGNTNITAEILAVTSVPGCVSSSLNPDVTPSPFSDTNVQITIGILAAFLAIFLIMTIVFGVLWGQSVGGPAVPQGSPNVTIA